MTAAIENLVFQTTAGTGTGNLTLAAATGGFQTFNGAFGNGVTTNVFYYFISSTSSTEWEVGTGHMSDATTLVRDTVLKSSNANAAVSFSAGTKNVDCDIPASMQLIAPSGALPVANGGTGVATLTTAYGVLCGGTTATGNVQTLAALGAAGTVLTSNGAGALPSMQAPAGGSELVLLATATASSSATLDFTSVMTSGYHGYMIFFESLLTSGAASIGINISTNNGVAWTVGIESQRQNITLGGTTAPTYTGASNAHPAALTSVSGAGFVCNGWGKIFVDSSGSDGLGEFLVQNDTLTFSRSYLTQRGGSVVNAFQILPSAGTLTSGTVYLYGIKNT